MSANRRYICALALYVMANVLLFLLMLQVTSAMARGMSFHRDPRYSHHGHAGDGFYHSFGGSANGGRSAGSSPRVGAIHIHVHLPHVGHIRY